MKIFYWVDNEWGLAFFDNLLIFGNKTGYGWADKLCHCFKHFLIVIGLVLSGIVSVLIAGIISEIIGWLYEWIVGCFVEKDGASKFDIIANNCGMLIGILFIWFLYLVNPMIRYWLKWL